MSMWFLIFFDFVGTYILGAESLMNSFEIYNGCYGHVSVEYDITHNRSETAVTTQQFSVPMSNLKVTLGSRGMCQLISIKYIYLCSLQSLITFFSSNDAFQRIRL